MSKFILGTKQYMTQIFDDAGKVHPATLLVVGPVVVTQVKTKEKDGYDALQVGYGRIAASRLTKAKKGHLKDLGEFRHLREWRFEGEAPALERGAVIDASVFAEGDRVAISGLSKGKGFQGVVHRHRFAGGPRSHGQKHSEREPGSLSGGGRAGGRVVKGMRMAGRMGGGRVTVKNLTVMKVDPERGLMLVRGAVPGRRGTLVEVAGRS